MAIVYILLVLTFTTTLCFIEIPKILQGKSKKELWSFLAMLLLGTVLCILRSLDVPLPNPSDWVAWVYSPVSNWLKGFLE